MRRVRYGICSVCRREVYKRIGSDDLISRHPTRDSEGKIVKGTLCPGSSKEEKT